MGKVFFFILLICATVAINTSCNNNNRPPKTEDKTVKEDKSTNMPQFEFETEATMTGTLQEITYDNGGGQMKTYILVLDQKVTILSGSPDYATQLNVTEIQIGFSDNVKNPSSYLNKKITVKGVLYPEQTANDRRPATMIEAEIIN